MTRPNNSNLGFSLVELLTVVIITAIIAAIAFPSFQNKVFAKTVPQIESTIKIVSLKSRANAGNPYRISLQGKWIRVDSIPNGNCTTTPITASGWSQDPTQSFELPDDVSITNFPPNGICFDGTGQAAPGTVRSFDVINNRANSRAVKASITISLIGDVTRTLYDSNNTVITNGKFY